MKILTGKSRRVPSPMLSRNWRRNYSNLWFLRRFERRHRSNWMYPVADRATSRVSDHWPNPPQRWNSRAASGSTTPGMD
ncbi:hypothetical protein KCP73_07630 [Salmonella enterica subsp. enterica]|nr:hypothetical protein KCP73_07630 [Salmonella enterica subsp. enterica]